MVRKLRLYTVYRISNFLLTHLHCSGFCTSLLVAEGYTISEAACGCASLGGGGAVETRVLLCPKPPELRGYLVLYY